NLALKARLFRLRSAQERQAYPLLCLRTARMRGLATRSRQGIRLIPIHWGIRCFGTDDLPSRRDYSMGEVLTLKPQSTPNLSFRPPNISPHCCSTKGICTSPPAERASN